jgi:hypothetical protein
LHKKIRFWSHLSAQAFIFCTAMFFLVPLGVANDNSQDVKEKNQDSAVKFRGFGTLGIARSSSDQAGFIRDLSQSKGISNGEWSARIDSILGGQVNWQLTNEVMLVGQGVSRLRYNKKRTPEITWAYARWEAMPDTSIRIGRLGADFMMLADSRLVGYASLTARPPADFFGPLFFHHFDGVDASITKPAAGGLARFKIFAGKTQEKTVDAQNIWDTSGSHVNGVVADYWQGPWQLRLNFAQVKFSNSLDVSPLPDLLNSAGSILGLPSAFAAADALETKNTTSRFYSLGVVYDSSGLQAQGMANCIHHEAGLLQNSCAGYALVGYRQGAFTPYVGLSAWKSTARGKITGLPAVAPFDSVNFAFGSVMNLSHADQHTLTVGARWDVKPNVAFKIQWDAIRGNSQSVFPVRDEQAGWNGKTNVFSVVSDFVF